MSLVLATPPGQRELGARAAAVLERILQGHFAIERLAIRPDGIRLAGVEIRDPGGAVVATADAVRVAPVLGPGLLHGQIHILRAEVEGARVLLESPRDGGSPGLARAFAPRSSGQDGSEGGVSLRIDGLSLQDSALAVRREGETPSLLLRHLTGKVEGSVSAGVASIDGQVQAELVAPLAAPVSLELHGTLEGGLRQLRARAVASLGHSSLTSGVEGDLAALSLKASSIEAHLEPADAAALGLQPGEAVDARGTAALEAGALSADVTLAPSGGGTARVVGSLSILGPRPSLRAEVSASELRAAALDRRLPPLTASGSATVTGDAGAGRVDATLPVVMARGVRAGLLEASLSWDGHRLTIQKATLAAPGGTLSARGSFEEGALHLSGSLGARDARRLLETGRAIASVAGGTLPEVEVAGSAAVAFALDGKPSSPRARLQLRSPELSVAGIRATALSMDLDASGLDASPRGELKLEAERVEGAGPAISGLRAGLVLTRGRAEGRLTASSAAGPLHVDLGASVAPAFASVRFDRLHLGWTGAHFDLVEPAVLDLAGPRRSARVALSGPRGALSFSLRSGAGRVEIEASVGHLDLAALPPALVPPQLGLAGRLDLTAHLAGPSDHPSGTAQATIEGGALRGVNGISGSADLAIDGGIRGSIELARGSEHLTAALQGSWPLSGSSPFTATASLRGLSLGALSSALGAPLGGAVEGDVELHGTWSAIEGRLAVRGRGVTAPGVESLDADASLDLSPAETKVSLHAASDGASAEADVSARIAAAALLKPGALQALLSAPASGKVSARHLPLSRLPALGLSGTASVDAVLEGSVAGPRGKAEVELHDVSRPGIDPTEGSIEIAATDSATTVQAHLGREGQRLLEASATVAAPPETIAASPRTALGNAELDVPALPVPLVLAALGSPRPASGSIAAQLKASGTIAAPTFTLSARATGLALGADPLGTLEVEGALSGGAGSLTARLRDPAGGSGELSLQGKSGGELAGAFTARHLRVSLLGGSHDDLRAASGVLDGEVRLSGKPADPSLAGSVKVADGKVSWVNLGEVRGVAADLSFDPGAIHLRNAVAISSGRVELSGDATRGTAGWDFTLEAGARSFGVVSSDLLRAYVSGNASARGSFGGGKLEAKVAAGPIDIELPETPSRDIQDLDPHPDFVIHGREQESAAGGGTLQLVLDLDAPDVTLRSIDANLTTSARLNLRRDPTQAGGLTLANSRVTVKRGNVIVLGRRFEVERGLLFYGSQDPPSDPHLDVLASYDSPYAQVRVTVNGTVKKPATSMRSSPSMTEAEIATLLATGRPQLTSGGGGVAEGSGAASAIGAVAADQLRKGISAKLPVDVIGVRAGESGAGAYALEAGKYFTERAYVGYTHNFGIAAGLTDPTAGSRVVNENELHLEYQLTPRFSLDSTYGDAEKGSLDLFWKKSF